jgi:hypothetical protein
MDKNTKLTKEQLEDMLEWDDNDTDWRVKPAVHMALASLEAQKKIEGGIKAAIMEAFMHFGIVLDETGKNQMKELFTKVKEHYDLGA